MRLAAADLRRTEREDQRQLGVAVGQRAARNTFTVRIDGVEFTPFSRLGGRLRRRWFPKVTVTLYEPRRLAIPLELRGRARRHRAGLMLYDVMSEVMARRGDPPTLFGALLAARAAHGGSRQRKADEQSEHQQPEAVAKHEQHDLRPSRAER